MTDISALAACANLHTLDLTYNPVTDVTDERYGLDRLWYPSAQIHVRAHRDVRHKYLKASTKRCPSSGKWSEG